MSTPPEGTWTLPQDQYTQMVMATLQEARNEAGYNYAQVAEYLQDHKDYRITPDEYRAMEQGLTKRVPLIVVIYLAAHYGIGPERLLPMLTEGEAW